jgi:hypothetical protein
MADLRTPAKAAALAAIIFAAGIAVGVAAGATVVPDSPAASGSVGLHSNAPWFNDYRAGERNIQAPGVTAPKSEDSVGLDTNAPWFNEYRAGERGDAASNRPAGDHDARHPGGGGR